MFKKKGFSGAQPMSRSLRIYQKASIAFTVAALILLLAVLYLSVAKATITIAANETVVSANTSVEIALEPNAVDQVSGYLVEETFEKAETFFLDDQEGVPVEAKAGGYVTLINETGSAQPLVATTRLLSEEGVLFRLDEAVSIPAGGTIEAMVHADEPGLAGEIGASQFTIPGLSESVQSVIYAVSVDSMTGGVTYVTALTQEHLDQAVADLTEEIVDEAGEIIGQNVDTSIFDGEVYMSEVVTKTSDTTPGTETGSFNVSVTAKVTGIFYSTEILQEYAQAQLFAQVPTGYELQSVNLDGLQVEIKSYNIDEGTAVVAMYIDGLARITTASDLLSLTQLAGKKKNEVITMLESSEAIASVQVDFAPFWIKKVPKMKDHIEIIIE